jgi:osmotically-inducible protein OsmY
MAAMQEPRRDWGWWVVLALLLTAAGCEQRDQESLRRVARKLRDKTQEVAADTQHHLARDFPALGAPWDRSNLEARLEARLRGDKTLADAALRVRASGGTVDLNGTVRTEDQRKRAVELAESTVGVDKVNDSLEVGGAN